MEFELRDELETSKNIGMSLEVNVFSVSEIPKNPSQGFFGGVRGGALKKSAIGGT